MHRFLAPEAFQHNVPVQQAEMTQLVNDLLDDPMVYCPSSLTIKSSQMNLSEHIHTYYAFHLLHNDQLAVREAYTNVLRH